GEDFAPGAFSGRLFLTREADGSLRSTMPADIVANAARHASDASDSADRAEYAAASVIDRAYILDVASLISDDNDEIGYAESGARFELVAGNILRTQREGFAYEVLASDATEWHVETAGGVKLRVWGSDKYVS